MIAILEKINLENYPDIIVKAETPEDEMLLRNFIDGSYDKDTHLRFLGFYCRGNSYRSFHVGWRKKQAILTKKEKLLRALRK